MAPLCRFSKVLNRLDTALLHTLSGAVGCSGDVGMLLASLRDGKHLRVPPACELLPVCPVYGDGGFGAGETLAALPQ